MSMNQEDEKKFLLEMSATTHVPFIDLDEITIDPAATKCIPERTAKMHRLVPFAIHENQLHVAINDILDFDAISDLKLIAGKTVVPFLATEYAINLALQRCYRGSVQAEQALQELKLSGEDEVQRVNTEAAEIDSAPIVRIVNSILTDAVGAKASDIHIEPFKNNIRVRLRIDGDLKELMTLPSSTLTSLLTRIKIMADLNIAETKRPQDGRIQLTLNNQQINMRVSILPSIYGGKIVIRVLNSDAGIMSIDELGLSPFNRQQIERLMKISEGIFLVTGPTGSGKSTTLYSLLSQMNVIQKNIVTLEDPVEYQLDGINQVPVNHEVGMDFASGLRSILRQDPDIIMLGEIRDEETAQIAIRAAVTGHIVMSTLHTNDTVSSISRLADMNIPKYMITSAIAGILAQRLLKRVCPRCAENYEATEQEKQLLGCQNNQVTLRRGKGCSFCNGTGYKGRVGIHEVFVLDQEIKSMINMGRSVEEIKEEACRKGMQTLADSARDLVLKGVTTVEQMLKATYNLE